MDLILLTTMRRFVSCSAAIACVAKAFDIFVQEATAMFYLTKTPWIIKKMYPDYVWSIPGREKNIYLSFDDGPHPEATPFVLDALRQFNAKASFFCIGKNVEAYPGIYKRMIQEGHRAGNHTFHHLNGWKCLNEEYIRDILDARKYIDSNLFRPPYGRISRFQARLLTASENPRQEAVFRVIMWDVLSGDFDLRISPEKCAKNVTRNAGPGSIVVFHDSEKAFPRMRVALMETLRFFTDRGYRFEAIP